MNNLFKEVYRELLASKGQLTIYYGKNSILFDKHFFLSHYLTDRIYSVWDI